MYERLLRFMNAPLSINDCMGILVLVSTFSTSIIADGRLLPIIDWGVGACYPFIDAGKNHRILHGKAS
jgi:hypothetical protein